jgi:hypothetical protein
MPEHHELDRYLVSVWDELRDLAQQRGKWTEEAFQKLLEWIQTDEGFNTVGKAKDPYEAIKSKAFEITGETRRRKDEARTSHRNTW